MAGTTWTVMVAPLKYNFSKTITEGNAADLVIERLSGSNFWQWTNARNLWQYSVTMTIGRSSWVSNYNTN